jgi:hypothetical protein
MTAHAEAADDELMTREKGGWGLTSLSNNPSL